jgi:hypothetical protein
MTVDLLVVGAAVLGLIAAGLGSFAILNVIGDSIAFFYSGLCCFSCRYTYLAVRIWCMYSNIMVNQKIICLVYFI